MSDDYGQPDEQDLAEAFDETNVTPDGRDIASGDLRADVYDVTAVEDDADLDGAERADDAFDPDQADEGELQVMLELDDGVGEERSWKPHDAVRVADDDEQPEDLEAETLSDEALRELGYARQAPDPQVDPHVERLLDEGLAETFPASDPVSIAHRRG